MMRQFTKWLVCVAIIGSVAIIDSCKKVDSTPTTTTPVVVVTNNPGGPTFTSDVFPVASTYVVGSTVTITLNSTAASGTILTKVVRNDGISGDTVLTKVSGNQTSNTTIDIYVVPTTQAGKTVAMKYTVTDSNTTTHKAVSNTYTQNLSVVALPKVYSNKWTVTIGDQSSANPFLNTGGISGNTNPQFFSSGQLTANNASRNSIDIVCASSTHHSGVFLCAPSNSALNFDSIPDLQMNTWTLAQRNKTLFKRIPSDNVDVTSSFPTAASIKTKYDALGTAHDIVQSVFSTGNSYVFLTADGRYGAFTVLAKGSTAVKFSLAVESR